ncbi:uncharacterized protein [Apostichopus japonicus]|uniref:uncharacterized protein n=1 Tax=Stichopus japonicus TaxID=307972 RepID=UPI003AB1D55F
MKKGILIGLLVVAVVIDAANEKELDGCVSEEFVEYKTRSSIHCKFSEDCKSLYWYDNADNSEDTPTLFYDWKTKSGEGFASGEFDIQSNGNLIITNVSLEHERKFKVVCILPNDLFNTYHVDVVVTVTPKDSFPHINNCSNDNEVCLINSDQTGGKLTCNVHGTRPASEIVWYLMVGNAERLISSNRTITPTTNANNTFRSSAVIDLLNIPKKKLHLFICSAKLQQLETWKSRKVLVDIYQENYVNDIVYSEVLRERGRRALLTCSYSNTGIFVWRKIVHNSSQLVSYGANGDIKVWPALKEHYEVRRDGTIYIESTEIEDEGNFLCVSSDGIEDNINGVKLVVLVPPSPSYLEILGCEEENCVILTNKTNSYTCSISEVRPVVGLEWHISDENKITIISKEETSSEFEGLFNVKSEITLETTTEARCGDTVRVTCKASGSATKLFSSSREIYMKVNCTEKDAESVFESIDHMKAIKIAMPIIFVVYFVVIIVVIAVIWMKWPNVGGVTMHAGEMQTLIPNLQAERELFIKQIKLSYEEMILNPKNKHFPKRGTVPYVSNDLVIVPGQRRVGKPPLPPKHLQSYEEIFKDSELSSKNILIEGSSGIGKTAFAHNLLEEWFRCKDESVLIIYNIIIYISSKEVNNKSFTSAVKDNLLPWDTKLDEKTIEDIFKEEERILVILDDFDQYSDIKNQQAELHDLLGKRKMTNMKYIVLSKPMQYDNVSKSIITLTMNKFSPKQVDQYLTDFFSDSEKDQRKAIELKEIMQCNDFIGNLCSTPLFLFMIASRFQVDSNSVRLTQNAKLLTFLIDSVSKDKTGMDILCEHGKNPNCISKIVLNSTASKTGSWKNNEQNEGTLQDIVKFLEKGVLTDVRESQEENTELLQFSHDLYMYICTAHYLVFHATVDDTQNLLKNIDAESNLELFVYTCDLCECQKIFETIIMHLLNHQQAERYPYPVTDCVVQCFKAFSLDNHDKNLLQQLCQLDHIFHFKEEDSIDLREAKISLINICSKSKVKINTISFSNGVKSVSERHIALDGCSGITEVPGNLTTFILVDFEEKVKEANILNLIEHHQHIKEVLVYSTIKPRDTTDGVFVSLQKRKDAKVLVNWITYKEDEVEMISYPSDVFKCWLNCSETTAIKRYRCQKEWMELDAKDRLSHEKTLIREMKEKGVDQFFETKLELSREEAAKLSGLLKQNMETLHDIINEWHIFYRAHNEESKRKHETNFKELVDKLSKRINRAELIVKRVPSLEKEQTASSDDRTKHGTGNGDKPAESIRSLSGAIKKLFFNVQLHDPTHL